MSLFKEASNEMAYAKIGLYGWQGAGKTFTATVIALGIQKLLKSKKPIFFVDTETGSDWMIKVCKKEKVKLHVAKTRAFSDLLKVFNEVEGTGDVLIIDSVSHIWNELMSSYLKKKKRDRLILPDWNILKPMWRQFTDLFLTSKIHIIICGRAGWEWDQVADEDGHRELVKQGTKMKAEGEFGYEPSLLVEMERVRDEKNPKKMLHRASVLKDRSQLLDGEHADNPTFEFFMPHIKELNIGGEHVALDTSRTSEEIFDGDGKPEWKKRKERCEVILEEIEAEMVKAGLAGSSGERTLA
jgi:hypothetical protein